MDFRTLARFAFVWFCLFSLPLLIWDGLQLVIVALFSCFFVNLCAAFIYKYFCFFLQCDCFLNHQTQFYFCTKVTFLTCSNSPALYVFYDFASLAHDIIMVCTICCISGMLDAVEKYDARQYIRCSLLTVITFTRSRLWFVKNLCVLLYRQHKGSFDSHYRHGSIFLISVIQSNFHGSNIFGI